MNYTGATAKFQGQTSTAARYCVRERQDPKDVVNAEWGPRVGARGEEDVFPPTVGQEEIGSEPLPQFGTVGLGDLFANRPPAPPVVGDEGQFATSPSLWAQFRWRGRPPRVLPLIGTALG